MSSTTSEPLKDPLREGEETKSECDLCQGKHERVALPLSYLTVRLKTDPSPTHMPLPASCWHDHFSFNSKSEVEKLRALLTLNNFHVQNTAFLDQIFDTEDGKLAQHQAWLLKRDQTWLLGRVTSESDSGVVCVELYDNPDQILSVLNAFGITEQVDINNSHLKSALSSMEVKNPELISPIQLRCPYRIAYIPTIRVSFTSEKGEKTLNIDVVLSGGKFYTVGSIKTSKSSHGSFLEFLKGFVSIPGRGKLFLSPTGLSVSSDVTQWQTSEIKGILEPCIPYDQLADAAAKAVAASLPLKVAFSALRGAELEEIKEKVDEKEGKKEAEPSEVDVKEEE